jgi:hypothetical protein
MEQRVPIGIQYDVSGPLYGTPGRVFRDLYVLAMRRYRDAAANSRNPAPLV